MILVLDGTVFIYSALKVAKFQNVDFQSWYLPLKTTDRRCFFASAQWGNAENTKHSLIILRSKYKQEIQC